MRADAQRNRDHLVEVARRVFREQGYSASLDEIARQAGVGAGTLYRHFPNRDSLVDAVMQSWVDQVDEAVATTLALTGTPREILLAWFDAYVALISLHRGGAAKITSAMGDPESPIFTKCHRLADATERVVTRLVDDGALRPGVDAVRTCRLVGGVATVADQGELGPAEVRPLLEVVADGMLRPAQETVPSTA